MKQVQDRLALARERSRSRTATLEPAARASGAPCIPVPANAIVWDNMCLVSKGPRYVH